MWRPNEGLYYFKHRAQDHFCAGQSSRWTAVQPSQFISTSWRLAGQCYRLQSKPAFRLTVKTSFKISIETTIQFIPAFPQFMTPKPPPVGPFSYFLRKQPNLYRDAPKIEHTHLSYQGPFDPCGEYVTNGHPR